MSLKAAVLFEYSSLNGGEFSWLAGLPALREAQIEIHAIAPVKGPLADRLRSEGIPVVDRQTFENGEKIPQTVQRERLARTLRDIQPDVVHANSLSMSRLLGPVAHEMGIPSLGHIRDIVKLSKKAVADLNQIDRLLAVSHATRDWHVAGGVAPERVVVQYNGINLNAFSPERAQESRGIWHARLELPDDCRLIGNIGQLGLRKGTEKVLESAERIAHAFPDVHWLIAGERHSTKGEAVAFEARLHQLAASSTLENRVHFLGRVANIPEWMGDLTLLVHAARQEPLGRVLLEASAMGLPIVATDAGGTREILGDEGMLVPIDDSDGLAVAITALLSDPAGCTAIGQRGRKRAVDLFDSTLRGAQMCEHYISTAKRSTLR